MNKIKLLVVDDHTIMRDGIRALLTIHDDVDIVGEASEGTEAIKMARELNPDVVIMDIAMPVMDGLEATRRITKNNPKTKVLMLSQYNDKKYVLAAVKAGASGYVSKVALGDEFFNAIRILHSGGSYLYPEAARAVIEGLRSPEETDAYDKLTAREREILKLIADGHSSREIAERLYLSLTTVLGHKAKIMEKLEIHNRAELFKYALAKGLVSSEI